MTLGRSGEDLAAIYLRRKNFRIIKRNFRSRLGEIDIIARHNKTLVFCEVKTRSNEKYGHPFNAVNIHKQKKIRKVAEAYLASVGDLRDYNAIRFDVISILVRGGSAEVDHIENAF